MKPLESLLAPQIRSNRPLTRKFMQTVKPSGNERFFKDGEVIVSKTDLTGKITYGNNLFYRMADLTEAEAINAPHSIIRHPDMPRCVFKLLWDTIGQGEEIFAYVVNLSGCGDHYWVFAHVTPSFDSEGNIVGYHSNRRPPDRDIVQNAIIPLYGKLREIETQSPDAQQGMQNATSFLVDILQKEGVSYDEFIFSL